MSLLINNNTKVYILCPAYIKTGGPELLHQLGDKLSQIGINSYMAYYDTIKENTNYTPKDFEIYNVKKIKYDKIVDDENNIIIIPEVKVDIVNKFRKCKTAIWWLSVDNYLMNYSMYFLVKNLKLKQLIKCFLKGTLLFHNNDYKKADYHFSQSQYATEFLKKHNINNVLYLSDYINDTYLKDNLVDYNKKEDIVVYNPKKGYKFTKRIIQKCDGVNFIPIQNMTTDEVKQLLLKAKLYIDFGNHPGKDRIPREAAMCGCSIITGKKGSAYYKEDVNIPEEFKFEDKNAKINEICNKIKSTIKNYEIENKKFNNYRNIIKSEKEKFIDDINNIFKKI